MNKGFQVGWWIAIVTVASINLIALALLYVTPGLNEYVYSLVGEAAILIPISLGCFYATKSGVTNRETLALRKFSPLLLPGALLLTATAQYFITTITLPIQTILIIMFGADTATSQMMIPGTVGEFILAFFTLCIVAPVLEELLLRGVIVKLFERYGFLVCLISSSLIFALLHFELRSFIPIFFIGLLFGLFRLGTGSVFLTIILHSVNNFLSLCQLTFSNDINNAVSIGLIILATILFPVLFWLTFIKGKRFFKFSSPLLESKKTGISVAAILSIVCFLGYNFLLFLQRLINGECLNDFLMLLGLGH